MLLIAIRVLALGDDLVEATLKLARIRFGHSPSIATSADGKCRGAYPIGVQAPVSLMVAPSEAA
jgi:hypothetical protein